MSAVSSFAQPNNPFSVGTSTYSDYERATNQPASRDKIFVALTFHPDHFRPNLPTAKKVAICRQMLVDLNAKIQNYTTDHSTPDARAAQLKNQYEQKIRSIQFYIDTQLQPKPAHAAEEASVTPYSAAKTWVHNNPIDAAKTLVEIIGVGGSQRAASCLALWSTLEYSGRLYNQQERERSMQAVHIACGLTPAKVKPLPFAQQIDQYTNALPSATKESIVEMMKELSTAFDQKKIGSIAGKAIYPWDTRRLFYSFGNRLAEKLVSKPGCDIAYLNTIWHQAAKDSSFQTLCEQALRKATQAIIDRRDCKGFTYKVINEHGVECYLIGTIHVGTKHMAQNRKLGQLLDQCSELITEIGEECYQEPGFYNQLSSSIKNPLTYCIDDQLSIYAIQHGIRLSGLETIASQKKLILLCNVPDPRTLDSRQQMVQAIAILYNIDRWQKGEESGRLRDVFHSSHAEVMLKQRNLRWAKNEPQKQGLIEKIHQANTPIAIAVGAAHLYGPEGLLQLFRETGLRTKRI